jgi:hypothetical protein
MSSVQRKLPKSRSVKSISYLIHLAVYDVDQQLIERLCSTIERYFTTLRNIQSLGQSPRFRPDLIFHVQFDTRTLAKEIVCEGISISNTSRCALKHKASATGPGTLM